MSFSMNDYDENVRRVIPYYDEMHAQTLDLLTEFAQGREIALLDTGAGSGTFSRKAADALPLSRLALCDPLERMLDIAKEKLADTSAEFRLIGSEQLDYTSEFDAVTAIQCHHYFDRETRAIAVRNCFNALKPGGILVVFENTSPNTNIGKDLLLGRLERFGLSHGRTEEEVQGHSARFGTEFFPLTIEEHLQLFRETGFAAAEVFWHSYLQTGFYAVKSMETLIEL